MIFFIYLLKDRSLFGARKYSFVLTLETIVLLGGEFIAVPFPVIIQEWIGGREVFLFFVYSFCV